MCKMFCVYAIQEDEPDSGTEAFLNLPASPYVLLDALDKLRLGEGESVKFGIEEYYRFGCLEKHLSGKHELPELNALAQKLSELDDRQVTAFEGLLNMEAEKSDGHIDLPRLIDIAYSTDCCHVVDEVLNDSQLGWFCAETGFVPGAEELPESLFELLDFERIGREHRRQERGVIVERTADHPGGYVEQYGELVEAYKNLNFTVEKPDYIFRIGVANISDLSDAYADTVADADPHKAVFLNLPASKEQLMEAERELNAPGWLGTVVSSLDGPVPRINDMVCSPEQLPELNRLAQKLAGMEPKALPAYKALLEATNCQDLERAEQLMDALDQYIFCPQYSSPIEVARGELTVILAEPDAEMIAPYLNLYQYGEMLIRSRGGMLTDYGLIEPEGPHMSPAERVMWGEEKQGNKRSFRLQTETKLNGPCDDDCQPVQAITESPTQGGMEMR